MMTAKTEAQVGGLGELGGEGGLVRAGRIGLAARLGVVVLALAALASSAPSSHASHYRLPLDPLITDQDTAALAKAGVTTTLALLQEVTTADKRKALAKRSGLAMDRIETLAKQVDLIRLDGVGPSMVRLLQAAGVRHSKGLAAESAASLLEKMTAANESNKITPVLPPEGLIAEWIAAARRLPQVVTGLE